MVQWPRPSFVQQDGVESIPKDKDAEQRDVDGPLEASLLLGNLGGQARRCIHEAQRCGDLPWSSVASVSFDGARLDYDERLQKKTSWATQSPSEKQVSGPGGSLNVNPDNEVQTNGGIADFWYLDDGDILCDPRLALPYLRAFDAVNGPAGAARNVKKTEVIFFASSHQMQENEVAWHLEDLRSLACVKTTDESSLTLGVVTGAIEECSAQLAQKLEVNKAMHQKIRICGDTQIEHVLARLCLGTNKVNHILRVHGLGLWQEGHTIKKFDECQKSTLDRLVP